MNLIKKHEVLPAIIGAVIASCISVTISLWRVPAPIEFYQRYPSKVNVVSGDAVTITWREKRRDECDSIVFRRLIAADNSVTLFEPYVSPTKPTDREITSTFVLNIPVGLKEGLLVYRVHTEFRCNIVQRVLGGQRFVLPDIVFQYSRGET